MHINQNVSFSEENAELVHRINATEKSEGTKPPPPRKIAENLYNK